MVRLGVDEHPSAAGKVQIQQAMSFRNLQPEGFAIKLLCLLNVVYRKPTERFTVFEHGITPFVTASTSTVRRSAELERSPD